MNIFERVFGFLKILVRCALWLLFLLSVPAGMVYLGMPYDLQLLFGLGGTCAVAWLLISMIEERKEKLRNEFRRLFEEYKTKAREEDPNKVSWASAEFVQKMDQLIDGK